MLPKEPLVGVMIFNSEIHLNDDNNNLLKHRYYGVEIGLLFFRFSFMRIGEEIS
tara:strand:- start:80 stop:241 length:162 start_codon:yes stop_codon:yes gene_type:complete